MRNAGPGKFGFRARRQWLLVCSVGALSPGANGLLASASAHPHAQRRSCYGLLAVHDFPGAISAEPAVNQAFRGFYQSFCAFGPPPKTAAGGVDQLLTYSSAAAARAVFAQNRALGETLARLGTHVIKEGAFPFQTKIATTVTSDYFLDGHIPAANESAFDILHTPQVTTGPGGHGSSYSSSGTTGFIRVKNQIFSAALQNSLNPEVSTYPSQVRHLLRQVAHEL